MNILYLISGIIAVALLLYLFWALLKPGGFVMNLFGWLQVILFLVGPHRPGETAGRLHGPGI